MRVQQVQSKKEQPDANGGNSGNPDIAKKVLILEQNRRALAVAERKIKDSAVKCSECEKSNVKTLRKRIGKLEKELKDAGHAPPATINSK